MADALPEGGAPPADPYGVPAKAARARAPTPRHAASLVLHRRRADGTAELLMGIRHAKHRFMPGVLVFPGGRVDRRDHGVRALTELRAETEALLRHRARPSLARALGVAAIRELAEETGLLLGERRGERLLADLGALDYLCRAVTPPHRAMRFDARFLLAPAGAVRGELAGSGELEALGWYPLAEARAARLAEITRRILDEVEAWLDTPAAERNRRPLVVFKGNDNRMSDA